MKNVESSMDWMSFSDKMKQSACELSRSACPMVLVLPDGREIRFTDINVDMFDYKGRRGDTEYTSHGFKVTLLGAEVTEGKDDGSLANSPSGNGARMREALESMIEFDASEEAAMADGLTDAERMLEYADHIVECQKKANAALAAPARNCEVGTAEEQFVRFGKFCNRHFLAKARCDKDCPCYDFHMSGCSCCFLWAQMPYEEGADNGSK